jgi:cobalt/nickel transport system permease protein
MKKNKQYVLLESVGRSDTTPNLFVKWAGYRTSIIILLMYIFFVLSINKYNINGTIVFASFPIMFTIAARVSFRFIAKRLLLISPFILIMAISNTFFAEPFFFRLGSIQISSGFISAIVIILKSIVTILALISFMQCVPFYRICETLRSFHVPGIFVTQLTLLYRYSFLLAEQAILMQKARDVRCFGRNGKDILTTAQLLGSLLLRTNDRAEKIYRGMVARGFNGDTLITRTEKTHFNEYIVLICTLFTFIIIRAIF